MLKARRLLSRHLCTIRLYRVQLGQGAPQPIIPASPMIATPPSMDPHGIYWYFHRLGKDQYRGGYKSKEHREKEYIDFVTKGNINVQDIALNTLKPMPFSKKKRVRLGRGRGSGRGRTSGRGHNGQKQRNGVNIPVLFEGGQTPMFKRIPKLMWTNRRHKLRYKHLNIEKLQYYIDTGRIDTSSGTITMKTLKDSGILKGIKWPGVKLLARVSILIDHNNMYRDLKISQAR
jgi:ribosomal protein L15